MVQALSHAQKTINDQKVFPNRSSLSKKGLKEIKTQVRRLYRIFAFSYFEHKQTFDEFEKKHHLCERYTRFLSKYKLMDSDQFIIPKEAFSSKSHKKHKESK